MNNENMETASMYPEYVIDELKNRHKITTKLGQGGQGAVFRTMDKNLVIKAKIDELTGEIIKDAAEYEHFRAEIDKVRILNLPDNLHIAKPIQLLIKPYNGYLMRLLSEMVPVKKLMIPPNEGLAKFYIETGGLLKRLKLLTNTAYILHRLHSLPVVYADISPENIFVSEDADHEEVWFIDSDNLRYTVDFDKIIYTPGYGAPEIVREIRSNNTLSDVYSFAVLAYELLTMVHPFEGNLVLNGEEEDNWDSDESSGDASVDNYTKAFRGEFPWIEDEEDDRNFSEKGIQGEIVLSKGMRTLFQQTFGYEGRNNPASRPSMNDWYEVLQQASEAVVQCDKCGGTYYFHNTTCPFCNEPRQKAYMINIIDRYNISSIFEEEIEDSTEGMKKVEILDKSRFTKEELEKLQHKKVGFKVLKNNKGTHYLYNFQTEDILVSREVQKTIEIKLGKIISIKNLMNRPILIMHNGTGKELAKDGIYDCHNLQNLYIICSQEIMKIRYVSFNVI